MIFLFFCFSCFLDVLDVFDFFNLYYYLFLLVQVFDYRYGFPVVRNYFLNTDTDLGFAGINFLISDTDVDFSSIKSEMISVILVFWDSYRH